MARILPFIRHQFFDSDGNPLVGGKIYTYVAGTTTPLATYTDKDEGTENANPIILDANGEASIWINDAFYKFVIADSSDVVLRTIDKVTSASDVTAEATAAQVAAEAAQAAAEAARDAALTAETNAETAETNAETAETNAETAQAAAEAARDAALTAETNAELAETNAELAETNAEAAQVLAEAARDDAETAATAAASSASAAAASASAAATAAASSLWNDVSFKTSADSPISISNADSGTMFVIDCTGGNVVVNLPAISALTLTPAWAVGFKKSDTSANTITVNRNGTDTIDGGTSIAITRAEAGATLIPDVDPTPDEWTSISFGEVPISGSLVGTTDVQTLTNKTLVAPFVDVATIDGQASTPTNPSAGNYKVYVKDSTGKLTILNSSGTETDVGVGSTTLAVASKTGAYTATTSDDVLLVDATSGAITITLYAASGNSGKTIRIKKTDSSFNLVTIDGNSSETIDGATTIKLATQSEAATLVCDGTNWSLVDRRIPSTFTSYTPTLSWVSNATGTAKWRRIGDSIHVIGRVAVTGTPTTAVLTFTLPSGLTLDTAKLGNTTVESIGTVYCYDDGSSRFVGAVNMNNTTSFKFGTHSSGNTHVSQASPHTWAVNDNLEFFAIVPITNWEG